MDDYGITSERCAQLWIRLHDWQVSEGSEVAVWVNTVYATGQQTNDATWWSWTEHMPRP